MLDTPITPAASKNLCDHITLSDLNQIQPHGGLLILDKSLHIIQYSENVTALLNTNIEQLLNTPVSDFLESENANEDISVWLAKKNNKYEKINWKSQENKIQLWVCAHQAPEYTILEIEPLTQDDTEDNKLFDLMQDMVGDAKSKADCQNTSELLQRTCDEIQKITGFDRVIAYQFDKHDDSGVVVSEVIANDMESYIGLHFPATDIPLNVRTMYLNTPIRYIPSIHYESEKILPEMNPLTKTYTDLSNTTLRMVSPVHITYLKNMGVEAATSIAIIHNKKLWGLIACHHKKPKYLSVSLRLILMFIGNALGIQVTSIESTHESLFEQRSSEKLSLLTENIYKEGSLISALDAYHQNMIELVGATGMSIYFQDNLLSYGETPTKDQVLDLIDCLKSNSIKSFFSTSSLPLKFKPSMDYKDKACGLLVVPLTRLQNHYVIFYRPERIHSVFWAGNPAESLRCHGDEYTPRDSFERFIQTITNHATPWVTHDIKAAESIRSIIVNKQLQDLLQVKAMHDPLTGLLNRLYLDQQLEIELNRAERNSQHLAIILTDLDFFKNINDNFGHQAGDYVLAEFASFLKNFFRNFDYIYRYGGEEFLILLPDTNNSTALQKLETLRTEIKKLKLEYTGKTLPFITISSGVAVYPDNGSDGKSLIAAADTALYKAKSSGRDKAISALSH